MRTHQERSSQLATVSGENQKLRVLHFAPRVCWPLDTGAKLRNYHLARTLAERAEVTLLAFADEAQTFGDLETFYERIVTVPRDPGYTPAKILRGALGPLPLPVINYKTRAMTQALARLLDDKVFDLIQVETETLLSYLPIIRASRCAPIVVCDWHNIDSEVMWRYSEHAPTRSRHAYARTTARRLEAFERDRMNAIDGHIAVSERDRKRLLHYAPTARLSVIENGVDIEYYSDGNNSRAHEAWIAKQTPRNRESCRHRIVFVGSMDYHANVDSVVNFANNTWPCIHDRKPELLFTIVGRDPAPEVRRLASLPGVEVTGTVEDVRPYYHEATAQVVPLRIGGGSRLKILEAMAAGVPVISTSMGAEGLAVKDGENIIIADQSEEMCRAILCLADLEAERKRLAANALDLITERYDWSMLGARLFEKHCALIDECSSSSN